MSREVMQQALDVLKQCLDHPDADDAITALREALAQPEPTDPDVADVIAGAYLVSRGTAYRWMREALKNAEPERTQSEWANIPQSFSDWWNQDYDDSSNPFRVASSAYWAWAGWRAAQPAKPLTDDEIEEIHKRTNWRWGEFARAIEAAHGIKEKT